MNPVHEENGEWYFWDEVWADRYGPYSTEVEAKERLKNYGKSLEKQGKSFVDC